MFIIFHVVLKEFLKKKKSKQGGGVNPDFCQLRHDVTHPEHFRFRGLGLRVPEGEEDR